MASQDWLEKDFYATLGVSKEATPDEIKKSYRKLARKYHPDANPGDASAETKFKEITEAYTVLSSAAQRKEYDALKAMGSGARFTSGAGGPGGSGAGGFEDMFGGLFNSGGNGGQRVRYTTSGGGMPQGGAGGFEDILGGMFGGGGRGFGQQPQSGADIQSKVKLSFAQSIEGAQVTINAAGHRVTRKIPAGIRDGQRIRVRGRGAAGIGGGPAGDLIINVSVAPDPIFERDGDNLRVHVPVTFAEAALGAVVEVPTYRGEPVKVRVKAGTQSGHELRIRKHGVATQKRVGDLIAIIEVAVPSRLNAKAKQALQALAEALPDDDPRAELLRTARSD